MPVVARLGSGLAALRSARRSLPSLRLLEATVGGVTGVAAVDARRPLLGGCKVGADLHGRASGLPLAGGGLSSEALILLLDSEHALQISDGVHLGAVNHLQLDVLVHC